MPQTSGADHAAVGAGRLKMPRSVRGSARGSTAVGAAADGKSVGARLTAAGPAARLGLGLESRRVANTPRRL